MAKLTLTDITNTNIVTPYNANNDAIIAALEKCLFRDGTSPNQMEADLDMNSNNILNVGQITVQNNATETNEVVRYEQLVEISGIDYSTLDELNYAEIDPDDLFVVYDASAGVPKAYRYRKAHNDVIDTSSTAFNLAESHLNSFVRCTAGTAVTITIPQSLGGAGSSVTIGQWGAGQITVAAGVGVTLRSPNGALSADQYTALELFCVQADEWVVLGDVTT